MPLRAYCEERFRITVSLGPSSALGEKGKKRGQIGKISAISQASRAASWEGGNQDTARLASLADIFPI